jgi:hypothetical protein
MVSLYITAIGYLVQGTRGAEAYGRLEEHGYLSVRALAEEDRVIALIEKTRTAFPRRPAPGHESWRDVDVALERAGYLSDKGLRDGRRGLRRDGTDPSEEIRAHKEAVRADKEAFERTRRVVGALAVTLTMALYLVVSCLLYRMRILSADWEDFYHSDSVVFVFPGLLAGVATYVTLRRLGAALGASVFVTLGCLVVTFGLFLLVVFNAWST